MDKQFIIEQLKKIKPVLSQKYGITELALFGSYNRDEENEKSDIDIMVDYQNPMGMKFFDIVYELEEVFKEKKVQVVTRNGIRPKYFNRIKPDLIYA